MDQFPFRYLHDAIRHSIETGVYPYGSLIPSERALSEQYMVSRTTVRKAIDLLIDQGLLYRIQGKGTFVSLPLLHVTNTAASSKQYLEEIHLSPSTNIIYTGIRKADYKYRKMFQLSENAEIYHIVKQHCDQNIPYSVEYSYLPLYAFPNISTYDFSQKSFLDYIEEHHITITRNHRTLDLVTVSKPQSTLLGIEPGKCAFMRKNYLYDNSNRIIEYNLSYSVAEKYVFEIF